jgi:esterase/lipase superfamily enzyme
MQAQYDADVANEIFPFIDSQCQMPGVAIATLGASIGAYHAAKMLFKHPAHVKRCYVLYDMRDSMDGMYDDNFYFNNPVDYMANLSDRWYLHQYASCDIRLLTSCGPWENSGPTYRMSEILRNRGIAHHLDDWGPNGGHQLALLGSPDVGIHRRALLKNSSTRSDRSLWQRKSPEAAPADPFATSSSTSQCSSTAAIATTSSG